MTRIALFVLAGLSLLLCACAKYVVPLPKSSDYVHLYGKGGWGLDDDVWLYPDDSFTITSIHSDSQRVKTRVAGRCAGLFHSVTHFISKQGAWRITTKSLKAEIDAAKEPGTAYGVMDVTHEYLDVRLGSHRLSADFYGADQYAEMFPTARSVRKFSEITKKILTGIWTSAPGRE